MRWVRGQASHYWFRRAMAYHHQYEQSGGKDQAALDEYAALMRRSMDVQRNSEYGPWRPIDEHLDEAS